MRIGIVLDMAGASGNTRAWRGASPWCDSIQPGSRNKGQENTCLNNGKPSLAKNPATNLSLLFDQRGPGFLRTLPDGTLDIGAYQHQGTDRIFADPFESGP